MKLTSAHTDDRKPLPDLCASWFGRLYGDKGYLSKALSEPLRAQGIELIAKVRKN